MDLEARSLQAGVKAMLLAKLREYKADLNKLKKEVKKITSPDTNQVAREELLESGMVDAHMVCLDQSVFSIFHFSKISTIFHQGCGFAFL